MAKVHPSGLNNTTSSSYSKKGYSILLNYFKNTNESLNKLKFVEDDSANESDIFARGNEDNGSNKYSDTNAKIVEKSVEGETMKQACQSGNLTRIKYLIETAKVDPNQPDEQNVFPLHWAAINNRIQVAEYLLEKGDFKRKRNILDIIILINNRVIKKEQRSIRLEVIWRRHR